MRLAIAWVSPLTTPSTGDCTNYLTPSILPRLAGQQARDCPGERTPEVVQRVIDSAPYARSYYSDAFGGAAFSFTRLLVGV